MNLLLPIYTYPLLPQKLSRHFDVSSKSCKKIQNPLRVPVSFNFVAAGHYKFYIFSQNFTVNLGH